MKIRCVWEHNGDDTLLYAADFLGAYTRGESLETAIAKMPAEIDSFAKWAGVEISESVEVEIAQEKPCDLQIADADSDVIFDNETVPLSREEYEHLKALALKSAEDFYNLYISIPDADAVISEDMGTFYGKKPKTAREMYDHTKSVNTYYFAEIGVAADNNGDIYECRERGFELLEKKNGFLNMGAIEGSYGEMWSVKKVLRRFIWHDRIHAKAMYRRAAAHFGKDKIDNPFGF
ncbi:MAG: hypothetical protein IJ017_08330 [Oscillospiraceae bacterium]|nr:hypothetical protein [Oscillospiraceae bacterium]